MAINLPPVVMPRYNSPAVNDRRRRQAALVVKFRERMRRDAAARGDDPEGNMLTGAEAGTGYGVSGNMKDASMVVGVGGMKRPGETDLEFHTRTLGGPNATITQIAGGVYRRTIKKPHERPGYVPAWKQSMLDAVGAYKAAAAAGESRIARTLAGNKGTVARNYIDRGLGGSTVHAGVSRSADMDAETARQQLYGDIAGSIANVHVGIGQTLAGFQQQRTQIAGTLEQARIQKQAPTYQEQMLTNALKPRPPRIGLPGKTQGQIKREARARKYNSAQAVADRMQAYIDKQNPPPNKPR